MSHLLWCLDLWKGGQNGKYHHGDFQPNCFTVHYTFVIFRLYLGPGLIWGLDISNRVEPPKLFSTNIVRLQNTNWNIREKAMHVKWWIFCFKKQKSKRCLNHKGNVIHLQSSTFNGNIFLNLYLHFLKFWIWNVDEIWELLLRFKFQPSKNLSGALTVDKQIW